MPPPYRLRNALGDCEARCDKLKDAWRSCEVVQREGPSCLRLTEGLKEEETMFPQEEIV